MRPYQKKKAPKAIAAMLSSFNVSAADMQHFVASNSGLAGIDISRMSTLLLIQLTSAWKHRSLSTFAVTDVIQHLEGHRPNITSNKPRPFKGKALAGFWKAHFVDPRFLLRNIFNEWGMFDTASTKFDRLCAKIAIEEENVPSVHSWQGRLASEFVIGGYENRARKHKLTGEWIIFGVHEQNNFYLSLCAHSRSQAEDESIYNWLKTLCSEEFPQFFSIASKS